MTEEIRIDSTQLHKDFRDFLNSEVNERILFSGKFGTGKTTYLTEFFERFKNNYNLFHLYPLSYSVSPNEDVFELIKFDLLLQLYNKSGIELDKEEIENILIYYARFVDSIKLWPILLVLIENAGKVGKSISSLIEEIKKNYQDYQKELENEEKVITEYLISFESKAGHPRELDLISHLIQSLLERIKTGYECKKMNVLIIDDLDRLDPEHIFRLFNVFSINFGSDKTQNKFHFDKIIFVCDIENIKHMFYHKYGPQVDFAGYIDKFYSTDPYNFDNKKLIVERAKEIQNKIKLHFPFCNTEDQDVEYLRSLIQYCLIKLIEKGYTNLRSLLNVDSLNIPKGKIFLEYGTFEIEHMPLTHIFKIIETYTGGNQFALRALTELSADADFRNSKYLYPQEFEELYQFTIYYLIENSLPFLLPKDLENLKIDSRLHRFQSETLNLDITFRLSGRRSFHIESINNPTHPFEINPFSILLDCYKKFRFSN